MIINLACDNNETLTINLSGIHAFFVGFPSQQQQQQQNQTTSPQVQGTCRKKSDAEQQVRIVYKYWNLLVSIVFRGIKQSKMPIFAHDLLAAFVRLTVFGMPRIES